MLLLALLDVALALLVESGLIIGARLEENLVPFGFLGNFVFVLSDMLRLLLAPLVALLVGLVGASFGARFGQEAVLGWSVGGARVLTGLLTALGMTVVIGAIGAGLNWLYQFDTAASIAPVMAVIGGLSVGLMALLDVIFNDLGAFFFQLSQFLIVFSQFFLRFGLLGFQIIELILDPFDAGAEGLGQWFA